MNSNRPTMTELLPAWPLLSAFLLASLACRDTGPGHCYTSSPAVSWGAPCRARLGRRVALATWQCRRRGTRTGCPFRRLGSLSPCQYAGAAHLIWLGVQMLRGTQVSTAAHFTGDHPACSDFSRDGLSSPCSTRRPPSFSPPSAAVPRSRRSAMAQGLCLVPSFVAIAAVTDSAYALAAGVIAPLLQG